MSKTRRVLLMLLGLALLLEPLRILTEAMLPSAAVDPVPQCIAGAVLALLTLGLPAWLARPWESPRLLRERAFWPGAAAACLAAVLIRVGFGPLDAAWQGWLNIVPEPVPVPENVPEAMLYILALAVVPAVVEEAFFRGALLTGLLDGSRRVTAALLTTAAFLFMHGSAANLPSLLAFSFALTLLMLRTGQIAVPVTAHLVYNLTALLGMSPPACMSMLCCGAAAVLCGRLLLRQTKVAHLPMKKTDGLIAAAATVLLAAQYFV